jgi:hypothetical protein
MDPDFHQCQELIKQRIAVRQSTRFRIIDADDNRLQLGFHPFETGTGVRWTAGDATSPNSLFAGFNGAIELTLHLGSAAQ